jgi:hypothetical protein
MIIMSINERIGKLDPDEHAVEQPDPRGSGINNVSYIGIFITY